MTAVPPADDQFKIVTDALAGQIVQNTTLHLNLAQDAIVITEDKVRLCLIAHLKRMEEKSGWVAPAGVLATILAAFVTTTFHDFIFEASVWKAIFIVVGILDLVWLIRAAIRAWKTPTIEDVVGEMKRVGAKQAKATTSGGG